MTAKHTPGPWRTSKPTESFGCIYAGENLIAEVVAGEIDTDRANAALIAAAPELLEQLKHLVKACTLEGLPWARIGIAEQAIAKAEGRS